MAGTWKPPPGWQALRRQVFKAKGRVCHWCGRPASTFDHVLPLVLGGTSDLANLVPACARCNYSRGAALGNRLRSGKYARRPAAEPLPPFTPSRNW